MKIRSVLENAYRLIKDRSHWTKGAFFRTKSGHETEHKDKACKFCLLGAVQYVGYAKKVSSAKSIQFLNNVLTEETGTPGIYNFNDCSVTTHKDVLKMLRKAINKARRLGI